MAHIQLPEGIPGILGPMAFSPQTAKPLNDLADILLRGPNSLSPADREMIATYVSSQNDCYFCQHAHGAVAAYRLGGRRKLINDVKANFQSAGISEKLKALLAIAGSVQKGGKQVTSEQIEARPQPRRHRQRNSRHRSDRRGLLHVQPLRRWPRDLGADRSRHVPRKRKTPRRPRLLRVYRQTRRRLITQPTDLRAASLHLFPVLTPRASRRQEAPHLLNS